MARTLAELPVGSRVTDYISLGVLAKTFPSGRVREILQGSGKTSIRERDMPAHVVVYYVIEVMSSAKVPSELHTYAAVPHVFDEHPEFAETAAQLTDFFLERVLLHPKTYPPFGGERGRGAA